MTHSNYKNNLIASFLMFLVTGHPLQQSLAEPPAFKPLRYDENYEYLKDAQPEGDIYDPIKFIPLNDDEDIYFSLGGDVRERYEYLNNPLWGDRRDDGYLLHRLMLHSDFHASKSFRIFAQLKSGLVSWEDNPLRPTDKDELDLHQLFADYRSPSADFLLRLGRQELLFGSQRLVSVRDLPNVRLSFDGARVNLFNTTDLFFVRPVRTDPDVFDDGSNDAIDFWGLYNSFPLSTEQGAPKLELYYLGIDKESGTFDQGSGDEERHSLGSRLAGTIEAIDFDLEGVYQFGNFADGDLSAWTVSADAGYTTALPLKPRFGFKGNIATGDDSPEDPDLETYHPLFPKGVYINEAGILGPLNIIDIQPFVEITPRDKVKMIFSWDFVWRESTDDGIYGTSGNLLRTGKDIDGSYIGSQLSHVTRWDIDRHLSLNLAYTRFFANEFIENSGSSKDIDYYSAWLTYRF